MSVRVEGEPVGKVEERPTWWNQVLYLYDNTNSQVGNCCCCFLVGTI